jgi:hypothetical protein
MDPLGEFRSLWMGEVGDREVGDIKAERPGREAFLLERDLINIMEEKMENLLVGLVCFNFQLAVESWEKSTK